MIGQIAQGTSAEFEFQRYQSDLETPSTAYIVTDVLTAKMWPGDTQMVVATPTVTWIDATVARWKINFVPADTATLIAGVYPIRVIATRGAGIAELLRDTVEITAVPGAGVAPVVYCTYEDMSAECNWLQQFQSESEDQTGFAEQRQRARQWMDGIILRAAPSRGFVSTQTYWTWGGSTNGLAMDTTLAGYLSTNCLMLTTPQGSAIVRACACYAISLVLRAQQGKEMTELATYFLKRAYTECSMIVAEIDTNADGRAEYAIALSTTNTRYG